MQISNQQIVDLDVFVKKMNSQINDLAAERDGYKLASESATRLLRIEQEDNTRLKFDLNMTHAERTDYIAKIERLTKNEECIFKTINALKAENKNLEAKLQMLSRNAPCAKTIKVFTGLIVPDLERRPIDEVRRAIRAMDELLISIDATGSYNTNSTDFCHTIGNICGKGKYESIKVEFYVNGILSTMEDVFKEFNRALDLANELWAENLNIKQ